MNDTLLSDAIAEKLAAKKPVLIFADGMSASGKSTWADAFAKEHNCALVSVDDFFSPPESRAYDVPVEFSRILNEVILPFERGENAVYRPFSVQKQVPEEAKEVPYRDILIVEGVYCLHPVLRTHCDISLFFTVDEEEQKRRILERNGPYYLKRFTDEWIPNERRYFEKYDVRAFADFVIDTGL